MNDNNQIMTPQQTAEFIGLATGTLAKMRLRGNGPIYIKTGRRVFYTLHDINTWIDERKFRNTSAYNNKDT